MLASLANVQRLSYTNDRGHTGVESLLSLRSNDLVGFGVVVAALRVPHDDPGASQLGQHRRSDFTGVRTGIVCRDVLSTIGDAQLVPIHQGLHRTNVGERRNDRDINLVVVVLGECKSEFLNHGDGLKVVEVHLPVTSNKWFTSHEQSFRTKVSPGSTVTPTGE